MEGPPGPVLVHRVRPLPGAVPRVEHPEAPLPQAAHHGPARPHGVRLQRADRRAGGGPPEAGRRRGPPRQGRAGLAALLRPGLCPVPVGRDRPRGRLRSHRSPGPRGRLRRGPVGLHELRCMRRAVPRRHRAHRPHPRPAPPPGPHGGRVPPRAGPRVPRHGIQGEPLQPARPQAHGVGEEAGLRHPRRRRGHRGRLRG